MTLAQHYLLVRLIDGERALVGAYSGKGLGELEERAKELHARHVGALIEFLQRDDLPAPQGTDQEWLKGATLHEAEVICHDTWHDALSDLPPDVARYVREQLLTDHHELMRRWEETSREAPEPIITV